MANKLELFYPVKPFIINQGWGIYNPAYQQFGFSRHNGVDHAIILGKNLRGVFNGTIVRTGNQPNGGGIFIGLMSENEYTFEDGITCRVLVDFLHCKELLKKEGDYVLVGEEIAMPNNTGYSTGPHTHLQFRRIKNWNGQIGNNLTFELVDSNEANDSFDPSPYWVMAAEDYSLIRYQLLLIKQKVVELLKLFKL